MSTFGRGHLDCSTSSAMACWWVSCSFFYWLHAISSSVSSFAFTGTKLSEKRITVEMLDQIKAQIESFLLIQILICIAVGFFSSVALWALGVNQPAFWGAAAGVLSSV